MADLEAPVITSFPTAVSNSTPRGGDTIILSGITLSDNGRVGVSAQELGIGQVIFTYRNERGAVFVSVGDIDAVGDVDIVRTGIPSNQQPGTYTLQSIRVIDRASPSNMTTYNSDGSVQTQIGQQRDVNSTHSLETLAS